MGRAGDVRGAEVIDEPLQPALGVGERRAPGRALVERDRMSPGGCPHLEELRGDQVERFVPAASLPARVGARLGPRATHREVHPIAMIVELGRGPALGADGPAVRMRSVWLDLSGRAPASTVVTTGQCTAQNPQYPLTAR